MLSNTATPIYYGQFREAVLSGRLPVCKEIYQQMQRVDNRIANPAYYYDDSIVPGFIDYCENEATLTTGDRLVLLDSFKLWAEDLLSWFYYVIDTVWDPDVEAYVQKTVKRRLINKQFVILGRGGAKTMYDSLIQNYFLVVDPTTTHGVTTAPTLKQAEEVLSPIRTALVRARGPLLKFLCQGNIAKGLGGGVNKQLLASTGKGIYNYINGSYIEPRALSISKMQGMRSKINTVDEWLSGDLREDVIGALEQGASKIPDYIIIATSSEGTVRNASGDTVKIELNSILEGTYINDHVSIWYYKLDNVAEVDDPRMWVKAQPNIGYTVSYETYQRDVDKMRNVPASRNDILAKRFGIPMEGFTYFFSYFDTLPTVDRANFDGCACAMGADLSRGDDFCSFTFLFPRNDGTFGVINRSYITQFTLDRLDVALRIKYDEFIEEGSLIIRPGTVLDMIDVFTELDEFILQHDYDVQALGYDPYNAKDFIEMWQMYYNKLGVEKVIQGSKTESVPLGDINHLAMMKCLLFDQKIMTFCMGNAITLEDNNGNRKLVKDRHSQKIDAVAALIDAYVAWKIHRNRLFD